MLDFTMRRMLLMVSTTFTALSPDSGKQGDIPMPSLWRFWKQSWSSVVVNRPHWYFPRWVATNCTMHCTGLDLSFQLCWRAGTEAGWTCHRAYGWIFGRFQYSIDKVDWENHCVQGSTEHLRWFVLVSPCIVALLFKVISRTLSLDLVSLFLP